jgi:hypothetical protein
MLAPLDQFLELQYVANDALSSRAIELFGGGSYSHVDIVWPDGRLFGARSDIITVGPMAYPAGVQFRPPGYEKWRKVTRIQIPCSLAQKQRGLQWARAQEGQPYDKLAIIAFGFGRNWRTENAWFCSELATRMLEIAFDFELVLTPNKITPGTSACVAGALARLKPPTLQAAA